MARFVLLGLRVGRWVAVLRSCARGAEPCGTIGCDWEGEGSGGNMKASGFGAKAAGMHQAATPTAIAYVGVSCLFAWMVSLLFRGGVASGTASGGESFFDPFFQAATMSIAVTCMVLCLPPRGWQRQVGSGGLMAVLLALGVAGGVCVALMGMRLVPSVLAYYAFGFVTGIAVAALLMQWLVFLQDFDPKTITAVLLVAALAGLASFVLVHYVRKTFNSSVLTTGLSLAMLVGSLVALGAARAHLHPVDDWGLDRRSTLPKIVAFSLVVGFIAQFLVSFTIAYNGEVFFALGAGWGVLSPEAVSRSVTERLGCLFCSLVVVALLLVLRKTSRRVGYIVLVVYRFVVFALVMALGLSIAQLSQFAPPFVTYTFALLSFFLSQVGMWIIVLHSGFLFGRDTVGLIGYTVMSQFLGYFLGFSFCEAVEGALLESQALAAGVLIGLLGLACLVFLFVFTERDVNRVSHVGLSEPVAPAVEVALVGEAPDGADEPPSPGTEPSIREKAAIVRTRYQLTERETEVLELLARGRNAVSIQEQLCLSYNTVKAHKHNIYGKLGVHSQQELLTLMEGVR